MYVTTIVEITNKLLRHVSIHEVPSSGSSLVLAKITYECTEMCNVELKIKKNYLVAVYVYDYN